MPAARKAANTRTTTVVAATMPERTSTLARRTTSSVGRAWRSLILAQAAQDVLHVHHGVVHQPPHGNGAGTAERHHGDRQPEQVKTMRRDRQRKRDGDQRDRRGAERQQRRTAPGPPSPTPSRGASTTLPTAWMGSACRNNYLGLGNAGRPAAPALAARTQPRVSPSPCRRPAALHAQHRCQCIAGVTTLGGGCVGHVRHLLQAHGTRRPSGPRPGPPMSSTRVLRLRCRTRISRSCWSHKAAASIAGSQPRRTGFELAERDAGLRQALPVGLDAELTHFAANGITWAHRRWTAGAARNTKSGTHAPPCRSRWTSHQRHRQQHHPHP